MRFIIPTLLSVSAVFLLLLDSYAMDNASMDALIKSGIGPNTLSAIIEEYVIETGAFSVEELISMKKAGFSDQSIEQIVRRGSFLKNSEPIVYGQRTWSLRHLTPDDIIRLKQAGLSDEVIVELVKNSGRNLSDSSREEAFNLLESMGIIVDTRKR